MEDIKKLDNKAIPTDKVEDDNEKWRKKGMSEADKAKLKPGAVAFETPETK
jgi:hypothetical protein